MMSGSVGVDTIVRRSARNSSAQIIVKMYYTIDAYGETTEDPWPLTSDQQHLTHHRSAYSTNPHQTLTTHTPLHNHRPINIKRHITPYKRTNTHTAPATSPPQRIARSTDESCARSYLHGRTTSVPNSQITRSRTQTHAGRRVRRSRSLIPLQRQSPPGMQCRSRIKSIVSHISSPVVCPDGAPVVRAATASRGATAMLVAGRE